MARANAQEDEGRVREQSEAPSSPTVVGSELPKSKTYPDPEKPHVAFAGVTDTSDADADAESHPTKSGDPPNTADDPNTSDPATLNGPSDPSQRAAPATALFTEAGGVREGPAQGKVNDIPTIVASPTSPNASTTNNAFLSPVEPKSETGETLPSSARMPGEQSSGEELTGQQLRQDSLSVPKSAVAEGEKPRLSGESDIRPEGTGTKRMFQLSKRFSMSLLIGDCPGRVS